MHIHSYFKTGLKPAEFAMFGLHSTILVWFADVCFLIENSTSEKAFATTATNHSIMFASSSGITDHACRNNIYEGNKKTLNF